MVMGVMGPEHWGNVGISTGESDMSRQKPKSRHTGWAQGHQFLRVAPVLEIVLVGKGCFSLWFLGIGEIWETIFFLDFFQGGTTANFAYLIARGTMATLTK